MFGENQKIYIIWFCFIIFILKLLELCLLIFQNGYVLVNATRCIITREECEEIKANLI